MATTVTYKGQTLATVENQTKTLQTAGTWVEDDFTLTDVSGGGTGEWTTDGIADSSEPSGNLTISSNIHQYAFYDRRGITGVTLTGNTIGNFGFAYSTNLQSVSSNTLTTISEGAFRGCTGLTSISLPTVTTISGRYDFENTRIATAVFPNVTSDVGQQTFNQCSLLTAVDLGKPTKLGSNALANCPLLTTLVIRRPSVTTLQYANCFNASPFASGGTGGTLYVPSALIASYQSATNWSTILGYANNSIQAIEGSIYETHYADGTVIA